MRLNLPSRLEAAAKAPETPKPKLSQSLRGPSVSRFTVARATTAKTSVAQSLFRCLQPLLSAAVSYRGECAPG